MADATTGRPEDGDSPATGLPKTACSPAHLAWLIEAAHQAWVVLWLPYHRTFAAWGGFGRNETPFVEAADPGRLVEGMREAEFEWRHARQLAGQTRAGNDGEQDGQ